MHNRAKHSNGMTGSLNLLQEKVAKAGLVLRRDRRKRVLLHFGLTSVASTHKSPQQPSWCFTQVLCDLLLLHILIFHEAPGTCQNSMQYSSGTAPA